MEQQKYSTTVVTAYYKIADRPQRRSLTDYMLYGKVGTLSLNLPLVLFTDSEEMAEYVRELRNSLGYGHLTHVICHSLTDSSYYADLEKIEILESTGQHKITNANPEKDTPYFITVTNSKFYCLERAIELDIFSTSHFAWIDFGASHVAKNLKIMDKYLQRPADKIRQMVMSPYTGQPLRQYFSYVQESIAATMFTGDKESMYQYCQLFRQTITELLEDGIFNLEQGVMGLITHRHPELFNLYTGSYDNIAEGYLEWNSHIYSHNVAKGVIQKYLDNYNHQQAFHLLQYVGVKEDPYWYLKCRLLADWYIADKNGVKVKKLATDVRHLIDVLKITDTTECDRFLKDSQHILSFYH